MLRASVSGNCKDGYVTYNYTDFQICLKYVPDSVRYTQARAHCEEEGGDLIKMDTTLKYDIFKEMLSKVSCDCPTTKTYRRCIFNSNFWKGHLVVFSCYNNRELEILSRYTCTHLINMFLYFPSTQIIMISLSLYRFIFLAPFASQGNIEVWIQAIKVGQDWRFHDGSPLTFAFPTDMTNGSEELHLRCKSDENFKCHDIREIRERDYMCEYYRQFL